jgi:hypothetical protein
MLQSRHVYVIQSPFPNEIKAPNIIMFVFPEILSGDLQKCANFVHVIFV